MMDYFELAKDLVRSQSNKGKTKMFAYTAKYFSKEFKVKTFAHFDATRESFANELRACSYMKFGFRFNSNEECWQSFCGKIRFPDTYLKHDSHGEMHAKQVERDFDIDTVAYMRLVWDALKNAAECDYHYDHEKDYS